MASLRVLAFDHDGRPVQFDKWLDDLQLYLLSDIKDVAFSHAAARFAIRNHLPLAQCAHFRQHSKSRIAIIDLKFYAILSAMYALFVSAEGDCYRCVPPDPGIAAAALGASESGTLPGTAPAEALHTFTLDSGASRCFFCDSTTLTPLPAPVPVRLADPSEGPVVARSSTVLPCSAVPSGSLSGLHLPSFSTNLVSTAALQDAMVTTTTWGSACVDLQVHTDGPSPGHVHSSARVESVHTRYQAFSGRCVYSGVRVRSRSRLLLVSPHVTPDSSVAPPPGSPLPASPSWHALSSSSLWSPQVSASRAALACPALPPLRQGMVARRSSLLLVSPDDCSPEDSPHGLDDYTRYTTVFPLRSKGQVVDVLIPWICTVRLQLREQFGQDLPVLGLHSDRGGEFSSNLLRDFCRGEGILQLFTLPDSPQQNGIAERRIGLVMEVARTSMIHAAAPHFLWPFAVRYAVHQLNLWARVSLPETSPTLRWTGEVGDASVYRVWGSRAFVRDTSADKLSPRAILCFFLGFVPDASGWQFYHPTSCRLFPSQDVTFDKSVPFYRLFPYRSAPPPPPPLFLAPGPPPVDTLPPQGPAPSGFARGAASGGAASGGAELGGAESEGAEPGGVEPGVLRLGVLILGVLRLGGGASSGAGGPGFAAGAGVTGGAATTGPEGAGAGVLTESGTTGAGGTGAGGAGVGGLGAGGAGVGGPGIGGAGAGGAGAIDSGGAVRLQPRSRRYSRPLLYLLLLLTLSSQAVLQCIVSLRLVLSRLFALLVPRSRPPPVPGTHTMTLRPSSVPLRVLFPAPPESSLPESAAAFALVAELLDFAAACLLDYATALVAKSAFASPPSVRGECALGTDVLEDRQEDFESLATAVPRFASMLLAPEGEPDAPDIPTPRSYAEAITCPYSSQWQAAMDAEMAS
ncbi:unnamed protein product [Closterium sp. NIES-53]